MPMPLAGCRILVTRTREQSSGLALSLRGLGAEVIEVPTIRIVPPRSYAPLDAALAVVADYDVLLVTSVNTARVLAGRNPPPGPGQPHRVAIAPATAPDCHSVGLRVDLQPAPSVAESVVRELAPSAQGKRMLLPQAAEARDLLPDALRNAGAVVDRVEAYRNELEERSRGLLEELFRGEQGKVDAVTFTSSSTVKNFLALLPEASRATALSRVRACSIGPVTSATLRDYGWQPAVEAATHDVEGLVAAVVRLRAATW